MNAFTKSYSLSLSYESVHFIYNNSVIKSNPESCVFNHLIEKDFNLRYEVSFSCVNGSKEKCYFLFFLA